MVFRKLLKWSDKFNVNNVTSITNKITVLKTDNFRNSDVGWIGLRFQLYIVIILLDKWGYYDKRFSHFQFTQRQLVKCSRITCLNFYQFPQNRSNCAIDSLLEGLGISFRHRKLGGCHDFAPNVTRLTLQQTAKTDGRTSK